MITRATLKRLLNRFGYEVHKFNHVNSPLARRMMLYRHFGVDLVFDVGAHTGGFASQLIDYGYRGRIVSFEPLSGAFQALAAKAAENPNWVALPVALGDQAGTATINIAEDPECSSLRGLAPSIVDLRPRSNFVESEEITLERLDAVFDSHCGPEDVPLLKLDVQGFEQNVLEGAREAMHRIHGVQIELSLIPHYHEEPVLEVMIADLRAQGFTPMSFEPVSAHVTSGQLLQVDGLFFRERR